MNGSDRSLETLVGGGAFFECPRWHDGRLWVSDYWRYQVVAISSEGTTETVAQVPGAPSGLGWLPTTPCWSSPCWTESCCGWKTG
jgi:hypothetical protein